MSQVVPVKILDSGSLEILQPVRMLDSVLERLASVPAIKDTWIMKHSGQTFQGFYDNLIHWNPPRFPRLGFLAGDRPAAIQTGIYFTSKLFLTLKMVCGSVGEFVSLVSGKLKTRLSRPRQNLSTGNDNSSGRQGELVINAPSPVR